MKKLIAVCLSALLCAALLAGCGGGLSDAYDEEKVVSLAHEVVTDLNNNDYDAVVAMMNDTMKAALPTDKLSEAWAPVSEQLGAFDSFVKDATSEKDSIATIVVLAKYANANLTFTISFNTDLQLVGLYMK
ncbi:hypothetical protein SDC9_170494 [bioreactor metagenome]|uniref:DUF3887 domain-containing protein n=1 Tax=bioreactor metagenome TaxID=1076179 RepID=A0A645GBD6_9ZZZZ